MESQPDWQLLVLTLPTQSATVRMRIWRAVKAAGCAVLRDGAYLLPAHVAHAHTLHALADECVGDGGSAWVLAVTPADAATDALYRQLFDRSDDYAALAQAWHGHSAGLSAMQPPELVRLQRKLQREFEALRAIDFFPGEASTRAESAWGDFQARLQRRLSPDEPQDTTGPLPRLDRAQYQGRLWATRRHLWVDRVASAWLIRRFIDPQARFVWLAQPADCPEAALGFDFDGAAFTHVGERVSFETLMASFGLDDDAALCRLGAMVHALDVGGTPAPEAAGFEAVLAGARERLPDDDALLDEIGRVLDSLYAHFNRSPAQP